MAEMWYYTTEGKQMDPVSMKELKRLVGDGTLKPTDMVWKEGMARWIRASSVRELFPDPIAALDHYFTNTAAAPSGNAAAGAVMPAAASSSPAPASAKSAPTEEDESARKKRRPADDRDERRPPRRRDEPTKGGSNVGIIIGIIAALGILFFACAGGIAIIVWVAPLGPGSGESINGQANYVAFIPPSGTHARLFKFRRGVDYEFIVTTQPRHPDVDLYIINPADNRVLASDETIGPDSKIRWSPNADGDFRVEVRNLNNVTNVTSTVAIREILPNQPPPEKDKKEPAKDGPGPLPPDVLEGKDFKDVPSLQPGAEREFKFRIRAGHKVSIRVVPSSKKANVDFNLFVNRDAGDRGLLASDDGPNAAASVEFVAQDTEIVRVRIVNASKGPGTASKAKLFYDVSP